MLQPLEKKWKVHSMVIIISHLKILKRGTVTASSVVSSRKKRVTVYRNVVT